MKGRASSAIEKLLGLQAKDAEVLRGGKLVRVPLAEVVVGDILRVKPGQKVAVDGVITEGSSTIDEAMVTGESMPVTKKAGDAVIGSTINKSGTFMFKATKIGNDTLLAQIVDMVKRAQVSRAPIQKTVDRISNIFVPAVLILAILTFVVWFVFLGADVVTAMLYEPNDKGKNSENQNSWYKDIRNPINGFLYRCATDLRSFYHIDNLCKECVIANLGGLKHKCTRLIYGRTNHGVTGLFGNWHTFTRHHSFINGG
jgi:hypothetical protein